MVTSLMEPRAQGVSAEFLLYEVTIVSFIIKAGLMASAFETVSIPCFSSFFHPLILAAIEDS